MRALQLVARHLAVPRLRRRWLITLLGAVLGPVPLIGTLGYESSLILSPVLGLLGIGIGIETVRPTPRHPPTIRAGPRLARLLAMGLRELSLLLALALAMLLLAQVWQRNCDPWSGFLFFLMGPGISGFLGLVCGLWGGVLGRHRRVQLLLAVLPFVFALGVGLWRLYAHPAVYAFDPFWGYFSGAIYDEDVAVGPRYLRYRGYNVLAATAAVLVWTVVVDPAIMQVRRQRWTRARVLRALAAVALGAVASYIGVHADRHGFTASVESISEVLTKSRRTDHFVIHYAPRSDAAREIDVLVAEHEFAWHRLERALGRAPEVPVHSFVFSSPSQKRRLMGAGNVEIAPPWRRQLYLNYKPFPHEALHHELAHIFEITIGDPLFGLSFDGLYVNLGLVEGLATALAPRSRDGLDIHDQAAILHWLEMRPELSAIMGLGFWGQPSRHAYTAAGSFIRWLIERHGIDPVVELYRNGGDFMATFGRPLHVLEGAWVDFLLDRPLDDEIIASHEQRFKVKSVFQRPCAHRVAELRQRIATADAKADAESKVETLRILCSLEPRRPRHQLALSAALAEAKRFTEARDVLTSIGEDPEQETVTVRAATVEHLGNIALHLGNLDTARARFAQALELPLDRDHRRLLELKHLAASDPELAPLVRRYLGIYDEGADALVRAVTRLHFAGRIRSLPGHRALGSYLTALQLIHVQAYEQAMFPLERSLNPGPGDGTLPGPAFVHAARERLLQAYTVTGRYQRARALLETLEHSSHARSGDRDDYARWRERIAFFERRGATAP